MNGLFLAVVLAVLGLSVGMDSQLVCKKKNYVDLSSGNAVVCAAGELCAISTAYKAGISLNMTKLRCLPSAQCDTIEEESIANINYKVNNTCCKQNLCNEAQSLRMTVWTGIVTMMFIIIMLV